MHPRVSLEGKQEEKDSHTTICLPLINHSITPGAKKVLLLYHETPKNWSPLPTGLMSILGKPHLLLPPCCCPTCSAYKRRTGQGHMGWDPFSPLAIAQHADSATFAIAPTSEPCTKPHGQRAGLTQQELHPTPRHGTSIREDKIRAGSQQKGEEGWLTIAPTPRAAQGGQGAGRAAAGHARCAALHMVGWLNQQREGGCSLLTKTCGESLPS